MNDYIIPCSVNEDSSKNFIMKNYFHLDRGKAVLISIIIDKPSKNYLTIESETQSDIATSQTSRPKKKLSIEIIIIIVIGILLLMSIVIIIIIIILLKKMKTKIDKQATHKSENRKSMEMNKIFPTYNEISTNNK